MEQCFKCHFFFSPSELKRFASEKSYCSTCLLWSSYKCEYCEEKFVLGDFSADYDEGKKIAWNLKSEHVKNYHS